jgi:hypothetical protein
MTSAEGRRTIANCAFIVAVLLLSCAPYITRLGLYSDDWSLLQGFHGATDQSLAGLFESAYTEEGGFLIRPLQVAYFAAQFSAFGLHALGYHVVNNLMLCAAVALLFLVCRRLAVPRGVALAISFVYGLAPHYSSDRFWYTASMVNLCMTLTLVSLLLALRARETARTGNTAIYACGSLLFMIAAILTYEITMPIMLLALLVLLYETRVATRPNRTRDYAFVLASVVVFAGLFAFKIGLQRRTTWRLQFLDQLWRVGTHAASQTAAFNFGSYGLLIPAKVFAIARLGAPWWTYVVSALVVAIVGVCVDSASRAQGAEAPPTFWWRLGAAGLLVFGASYLPFVADPTLDLAVGPNNRVAAAAAVGAAVSMTAIIGLVVPLVVRRPAVRGRALAIAIGLLCGAECLVTTNLAEFWVDASERQRPILEDIRAQFPRLEPGTVILLDGECPYVGPGIVFEGSWDLASALRLEFGHDRLDADVIRRGVEVRADGIVLRAFGEENVYRFGPQLIVYDHPRKQTRVLSDFAAAQTYFGAERSVALCPPSRQGVGVQLF